MSLMLSYFYKQSEQKYSLSFLTRNVSLDRKITWVHMVEDPENCTFLRGGELIVTTGLEIHSEDDLMYFVKNVFKSKACGLIINLGAHIQGVSERVTDWCSEQAFPLFTMPWEVHIADLMQEYCNAIISEKRVSDIRSDLLRSALLDQLEEEQQSLWDSLPIHYIAVSDLAVSIPYVASATIDHLKYYGLQDMFIEDKSGTYSLEASLGISEEIKKGHKLFAYRKQAENAFYYARRKEKKIMHFHDLGLYQMALQSQDINSIAWAQKMLEPIKEASLKITLLSYLEHDGSVAEVAKELYLHRNTVNYRLQKIRAILPDLDGRKKAEYIMAFYILEMAGFDK